MPRSQSKSNSTHLAVCERKFERKTMAMTNTTGPASNAHLEFIGMIVEIAGVASAVAGVVLSLHHWPAAVALIGGGVAYVVGKKLRAS
jgi:hypothetical protein